MPFICKGLCESDPNLFEKDRSRKIGIEVYFCRLCDKYIKIKDIIANSLFKVKNRCACCNAKFRVKKSRVSRQNKIYCKCECGERIDKVDKYDGSPKFYLRGHCNRIKNITKRKCSICKKNTKGFTKYGSPKWKKYTINSIKYYLCATCYQRKNYHTNKLKNLFKELNYSVIMKTTC